MKLPKQCTPFVSQLVEIYAIFYKSYVYDYIFNTLPVSGEEYFEVWT